MKIIIGLYYYYPYISGLSVFTKKLAEQLCSRGHEVTIVTSRYDSSLDREELVNGVRVVRVPVAFKLDKGVIMPMFLPTLLRLGMKADIVNLHLPMAEPSLLAMLLPKKTVISYICDPRLNSRGLIGKRIEKAIYASLRLAVKHACATTTLSFDYAASSRVLRDVVDKIWIIPPPIDFVAKDTKPEIGPDYFSQRANVPAGAKTIGFLGRIVFEKGIDFLIHAFHDLQKRHDDLYLLIAGDYKDVAGGSVKTKLMHFLSGSREKIRFTGRLSDAEVDAFYRYIDVLALPSIDPLEAYGMVQVEAMLRGTPVVASDLPGVRTIVQRTGMGKVVPSRDPHALAIALDEVLYGGSIPTITPEQIFHLLDLGKTAELYEELFERVISGNLDGHLNEAQQDKLLHPQEWTGQQSSAGD